RRQGAGAPRLAPSVHTVRGQTRWRPPCRRPRYTSCWPTPTPNADPSADGLTLND
ncbi:hypothetical protein ABMA28_000991, partial [Loxostege sticticalis]